MFFRVIVGNGFLGGHRRGGNVIPTAVIFRWSAVFRFWAVTTLAEAVKPKYGGNFSAVDGFSFFGGSDFGGDGKTQI